MSVTSKVSLRIISASGILAADKGGTSDAYATAELVDSATGKGLKKPRKTKTKTIKKSLSPVWDESEVVWSDIEENLSTLSLKVTLFDADMMSSETLGGVTIALASVDPAEELGTFPLETIGKMKESATGTVVLSCQVYDGRGAAEAAAAAAAAAARPAGAPARRLGLQRLRRPRLCPTHALQPLRRRPAAAARRAGDACMSWSFYLNK